jgi:hypothetical protein
VLKLAPVEGRDSLADLLVARGMTGHGVEVGTHRGDYARAILRRWPGTLHCVDHWSVPPGYEAQAACLSALGGTGDRAADLAAAEGALEPFGDRARLWPMESGLAASHFPDGSLDFAYIDGDHRAEAVLRDLNLWWPKLKAGGLLAGHDLICPPGEHDWGGEVQRAVLHFALRRRLPSVFVVVEPGGLPASFYLEKPA